MTIVVVAEKPSVARDIAQVLGARTRGDGCLSGNGYVVSWAVGHLVRLAQPDEIQAEWKRWQRAQLPMLPARFPLHVIAETAEQFRVLVRLMNGRDVRGVVCATDAGREGELIFRFIFEAAGCKAPVKRLWISSLTPEAIAAGFAQLEPSSHYDALADAARGRAMADWLVGMNLSRLYTLAAGDVLSVGRVQTPTLALLVGREKEIRAFVPEDYLEIEADFAGGSYTGTWFAEEPHATSLVERKRLPADGAKARAIIARVKALRKGTIVSRIDETQRMPPPLLYDLTELQRHCNRLFGFSADRTLKIAQSLYESKKLLSYPRTDSRHLSAAVAKTLPAVVAAIADRYPELRVAGALGRRFVDDGKVSDHHAIIPTTTDPRGVELSADEARVYDLVCRRLLMAWLDDYVWASTQIVTAVGVDHFHSSGHALIGKGWKVLDPPSTRGDEQKALPGGLAQGSSQDVYAARTLMKQTRPPKRLSDASLLSAMETAGKSLDDKELSRAMKDCGLGTPATRASMIETLIARGYVVRQGKALVPTEKGIRLIDSVHTQVKSAAMTGEWEARLHAIARGEGALSEFMRGIEAYVREVVENGPPAAPPRPWQGKTLAARRTAFTRGKPRGRGRGAKAGAPPL